MVVYFKATFYVLIDIVGALAILVAMLWTFFQINCCFTTTLVKIGFYIIFQITIFTACSFQLCFIRTSKAQTGFTTLNYKDIQC